MSNLHPDIAFMPPAHMHPGPLASIHSSVTATTQDATAVPFDGIRDRSHILRAGEGTQHSRLSHWICQRRDLPPTATQPSVGSGKEIPKGGGERARGEVAGFQNSESGALS